jgi:hypothetical protein
MTALLATWPPRPSENAAIEWTIKAAQATIRNRFLYIFIDFLGVRRLWLILLALKTIESVFFCRLTPAFSGAVSGTPLLI